ncbi:MAG: hypothetical protein ACRD5M_06735 [Candidatus Acidiferrales bacterium]
MGAIHGLNKDRQAKLSVAELLFDSFRSPMPAGVRSASVTARQMLFGAGNYRLDLRIEPLEDSDKVALLGQILNSSEPDEPIGIVAVVLRRGNKVLAQSVTNLFGEFELEFNLENSLQLHAHLPQGQVVRVPLVEPIGDVAARGPGADDSRGVTPPFRKPNKSTRKKV